MSILRAALCGLLLAAAATAAPARGAAPPADPEQGPPVPLLWRVSDTDNHVYLLGSFHMLRPGDYPLSPDVDLALEDAESLLFEMPPEELASPTLALRMGRAAMRGDGSALSQGLPAATARKLEDWLAANGAMLREAGLSPQVLQVFEPWYAGLLISLARMRHEGLDPRLGMDTHLAARAKAAGKPAGGFETAEQQIAFLDGMSPAEQHQLLDEALADTDEALAEIRALHAAWRTGDVDALANGMAADMKREYPALYARINVQRNDAWLPTLEARLARGSGDDTLAVVGALHLLGEDGVVEKLRAKGYRVERVCSACAAAGVTPPR